MWWSRTILVIGYNQVMVPYKNNLTWYSLFFCMGPSTVDLLGPVPNWDHSPHIWRMGPLEIDQWKPTNGLNKTTQDSCRWCRCSFRPSHLYWDFIYFITWILKCQVKFARKALDLDLKNLVPPWQFEFSAFQCPAVVNSSMQHLLKHIL